MTILNKLQNLRWTTPIINSLLKGTFIQNEKDMDTYIRRGYKDFENRKGKLFYKPLNLEVVPEDQPDEILKVLEEVYDRPESIGKGQNMFHYLVLQHYLGIRRKHTITFLKTKPEYQMRQDKQRIVSKGIQASRPYQYWACDLVDMNTYIKIRANQKYRYIFSCLDIFSKFCWFIPIKKKEPKYTTQALKKITAYNLLVFGNSLPKFPAYIVSDQGTEFKGEFEAYLKQNNIIHKTTQSYVPQPNIENLNGQLRAMMRSQFIKTNSLAWLPYIQAFSDSKNTNRDPSTGKTPLNIMNEYYANNQASIQEVADKVRTKNEERFKRFYKQEAFNIGDKVRVKMTSFQSALRQREKEGTQKLNVVRFSPDIYEIQSIRPVPQGQFGYPLYILKDSLNRTIRYANNNPRTFNSGDLLKIGNGTPANYIDLTRANYLNRNRDGNDLYLEPTVREEELPPAPVVVPIRQPKPVNQWKSKEWTEALKDKLFTDYDNVRSKILKVEYSRTYRKYVVDYRAIKSARQIFQEELSPILELSKGEDWFVPSYETIIDPN